nr:MAG TPA: hypothetical protein [Caudoviricetes sp.]
MIPFHSLPALFSKKIAQTLAHFNLITYLCHRYDIHVEHST